jgi:SAM-dependent methyltransferase
MSEPHSADVFGPLRDSWWNLDYLELIVRRLGIAEPVRVLDAGCGQGHWGQLLAHVLPAGSSITGIDREAEWIDVARRRAGDLHDLAVTFDYAAGDVLAIDFPGHSFDLVTCQTLLIHVDHPPGALAEMLRVLRPGGWLLCAEPNNLSMIAAFNSLSWEHRLDTLLASAELQLRCELGKASLGEGFNSAGELLPGWLAAMNVEALQVWISDKATPFYPPYDTPVMAESIADVKRALAEERSIWPKETTRRYWLAGGGSEERFEELWRGEMEGIPKVLEAIERRQCSSAGGTLMYLVAARKPKEKQE